ncbi:putative HVA22-like protein g [Juglans microcarpa x Juglans regia]|uniref:putative HVA22-like protein g n=1 Tax=Juglans microcarpa x Juglans regia TaxID=2249226 RepID=UPI001B7E93F6|nr:putative HVA22-like protein g [Juglans microcarpa x Juglans regia]XP_041027724.1 putative HVA22-like protein g [Juglans microcarpa x Juglans regia]XP_041027725.1 putative HVA22-like protein g [Juglans microcarpa x Juglans regia]XP_041027726.1 putative HVA22-like protein g [Juglans microcarpa x Juglans regia]
MLGGFITRFLLLLLGYAYPAFECYKTVEKNRVEIAELRFWCQYWILVAMLTVLERIMDIFMRWFPLYGEMKVALVIYLWHPKTKGTGYVYETLFRPYIAKHETDIDRKLLEWRARAWDLAIFHWQNCSQLGQSVFFQVLQYLTAQSGRFNNTRNERAESHGTGTSQTTPNGAPNTQASRSGKIKKWPPSPTASTQPGGTFNRVIVERTKSNVVEVHPDNQAEHLHAEDASDPENHSSPKPHQAFLKFRRSKKHN